MYVPFGPIADLSKPDGLLVIGGLAINLLPVIMTAVNVVSSAIFTKGYPLKTKIQLYAMAAFFLVFLYDSPSGLVFYWTLNNIFSLVKTVFYKLKNPRRVLFMLFAAAGLVAIGLGIMKADSIRIQELLVLICAGIALCLPLFLDFLKNRLIYVYVYRDEEDDRIFILSGIFLALLIGVLIPSAVIADSPQEFVDVYHFYNPLWFIVNSALLGMGTFVLWFGVFYWLVPEKTKVIFSWIVWIVCGVALVNYLFFGTKLGNLSASLRYTEGVRFSKLETTLNLAAIVLIAGLFTFLDIKKKRLVRRALAVGSLAILCMSVVNAFGIGKSVAQMKYDESKYNRPQFSLSKTERNVVVIMLDRALGEYVPYFVNEKPELKELFDGFTYYSNTVSFGGYTNFGVPALFGGYEYTPVELNKRSQEPLVDKHNEALKVMPKIFSDAGYQVSVLDPPYAGYQWVPDLSIYDGMENVNAYISKGAFNDDMQSEMRIFSLKRNFFCFGIVKASPVLLQLTLGQEGNYHQLIKTYASQTPVSTSVAHGDSLAFDNAYNVLLNLPQMTKTDGESGSFVIMTNDTTHEPIILSLPEYSRAKYVDNTQYDTAHTDRFTLDGVTLSMENPYQVMHYHSNMAALLKLGDWLEYLKAQGVYDNTRIIITSDHGQSLNHLSYANVGGVNTELFSPLLLVKDFDSRGFTTSREFMTNGDVPILAMEGLISKPVNPYTGKEINNKEKTAHDQYITASLVFAVDYNKGNQFVPADWYTVHDNIWDMDNWELVAENAVLPY